MFGFALFTATACKDDYRIGEYVWVEWDGREYPAYLIDQKNKSRFRVHYDGYDSRWDEEVTLERIKGRVQGPVSPPPPPDRVARTLGLRPQASASAGAPSVFVVGDRVRVRWRGSVYVASVVEVPKAGQLLIHYEGYGNEWDEVVSEDRVLGKR